MMNHGWGLFVFCSSLLLYLECNVVDCCCGVEGGGLCWCAEGGGCCTAARGHALHLVVYTPKKMKVLELKRNPRVAGRGALNNAVAHCP